VIVDAVALCPDERQAFAAVAQKAGVPFTGLWLEAPEGALTERVATRRHDASDATAEIVRRQIEVDLGVLGWTRIDTGGAPAEVLARAKQGLGLP
jgi:predicted kinase